MKIKFHNPNGSTTQINAKSLNKAILKYIHLYNRHVSSNDPFFLTIPTFTIPFTIIKG